MITITVLNERVATKSLRERGDAASSQWRNVDVARERRFSDERHRALTSRRVPLLVGHVVHVDDVAQVLLPVLALHRQLLVGMRLSWDVAVRSKLTFQLRWRFMRHVLALQARWPGRHGLRLS